MAWLESGVIDSFASDKLLLIEAPNAKNGRTLHPTSSFAAHHLAASITRASQNSIKLAADQFFNELPGPARTAVSVGSNQLSKTSTAASLGGCEESGFMIVFVMAWSPVRRFNAR